MKLVLLIFIITSTSFSYSNISDSTTIRIQNLLEFLDNDTTWEVYSLKRFPYLKAKHHFWLRSNPTKNSYLDIQVNENFINIWIEDQNTLIVGQKTLDKQTKLDIYKAGIFRFKNGSWSEQDVLFLIGQGMMTLKAFENGVDLDPQ